MKQKLAKYGKLIGIFIFFEYVIAAGICLIQKNLTFMGYSDALFYITAFLAGAILLSYISAFRKKGRAARKGMDNYVKTRKEIEQEKDENLNISFVLFILAAASLLGCIIFAFI